MSYPTILEVVPGSAAAAAGLVVGDELVAVNGVLPSDVIEYQQLVDEPEVDLVVRRDGLDIGLDIVKAPGAPLGLRLNSSIFDRVQTCDNHCEFCFIHQLPKGMRRSLYLKDDVSHEAIEQLTLEIAKPEEVEKVEFVDRDNDLVVAWQRAMVEVVDRAQIVIGLDDALGNLGQLVFKPKIGGHENCSRRDFCEGIRVL